MNPPFSDREKLPKDYLEKLSEKVELERICGHQVNLWGYFLALADLVLKPNGKIGVVIPINLFRGRLTGQIREFLLTNYSVKYIIKSEKEAAFSESAQYRDVLLIAEKKKPTDKNITKVVFLNTSIKDKNKEWVERIVEKIKKFEGYKDEQLEIVCVNTLELIRNIRNIMPILVFGKGKLNILLQFLISLQSKMKKFKTLEEENLILGFNTSPAGTAEKAFVTRPLTKDRIKQAFLVLENEKDEHIIGKIKNSEVRIIIEKAKIFPALRTNTGINRISVENIHDYLILRKPKEFRKIEPYIIAKIEEKRKKYAGKKYELIDYNEIKRRTLASQTYLALCIKFNIYSPNSHLFAFVNSKKFTPLYTFISFPFLNKEDAKILSIFFNSIAYFVQFLSLKSESQLQRTEIKIFDLSEIYVPDLKLLNKNEKDKLLSLYEKLKDVEFPSILEQFRKKFWARVELDKTILKVLGFSDEEIEEWLPKLYDAIVEELKAMKEVK
jgi:hypothetical protein